MAIYAAAALISFTLGCGTADEEAGSEGKTIKTKSGLEITEIRAGSGKQPTAKSRVKIHYHGTLEDGTVFDSSVDRGEPAVFPLPRLIPCWKEGIPMMREGGKSRLVCPPNIAYGKRGKPGKIPQSATLTFEVELFEVVR
jgi:FKBP-type peptidyl-prolyl cis-trans isomerase